MARNSRPDAEGYFYFAKLGNGTLYGPYQQRSVAAGVLTQMNKRYWRWQSEYIYDYSTRQRIPNPHYRPGAKGEVLKAKIGVMESAPWESLQMKYQRTVAKLDRITQMLNDRGIDLEID
jgi:hypothetical protein